MRAVLQGDEGEGAALVYVPGIDGSGELLFATAARLARRFRLVRLRYEEGGEDGYEALAASVVECLDRAGIDQAILLAESFGGAVALQVALDAPRRIRALAIVNSFVHYRRRWRLSLARITAPLVPPFLFRIGRRLFSRHTFFGRLPEADVVEAFCSAGGVQFDRGYRTRLRMIAGLDLRPRLGEVRQPVALFASGRDRIVDSRWQASEMAESLADTSLCEVEDGGHVILPLKGLPWTEWLEEVLARADRCSMAAGPHE